MADTIHFQLLIAPAIVFAIVMIARRFGAALAGFLAGLPYASAVAIYVIAAQHGDQHALVAIESAILMKLAFLFAAVCFVCVIAKQSPHSANVGHAGNALQINRNARPQLSTALIAASFSLLVSYVADHYSAKSAGALAGIPLSNLCIVLALSIKTNARAVATYVRGFIAGHLITIAFHTSVYLLAAQCGFQIAFVISAVAVGTIAVIRLTSAARTRALQSQG